MTFDNTIQFLTKRQRTSINILVIVMFFSMNPWMTFFYLSATIRMFIVSILAILAYIESPGAFSFNGRRFVISLLFFLAALTGTRGNINAFIGTAFRCLPFLLFINTKESFKIAVLDAFNAVFFWIIAISLFFWILFLAGVPLLYNSLFSSETVYTFYNYYFFVRATYYGEGSFPRFCSIFLEPGYVGCFSSFMLFLNKYDFHKWKNVVYLVAVIFTFSVAGWLLFFVGFIPFVSQRGRIKWAYWFLLSFLLTAFFYFSKSSDNAVGVLIGERVRFEDGSMVGYNRSSLAMDDYWENYFWNSENVLWGVGEAYNEQFEFGPSVDLRAYIIRYGLIATILYLLFFMTCFLKNRSHFGFWFFIIVLAFIYRGYSIMFWDATLFVYLAALTKMKSESLEANLSKL